MVRSVVVVVALGVGLGAEAWAQQKTWTTSADFEQGALSDTVDAPPDQVQLGPTKLSQSTLIWGDNYRSGFVVKLDTTTGRQLGRYDSALVYKDNDPARGPTGARPPREYCDFASTGNCPGRVTTDTNADVWIVNRAFGEQGTMSKFAADPSRCIDRDGNGRIDTSRDANGDGVIDPDDPAEFLGQRDECILATFAVGAPGDLPRGVAVDKYGKIWAATFNGGKLYRYGSSPIRLEATVQTTSHLYSLATGGDYVFASGLDTKMVRVNVITLAVDYVGCVGCYGVVADPGGQVAWCGGWAGGATGVMKADFAAGTCTKWPTNGQGTTAITLDLDGNLWAAGMNVASLYKLSPSGQLLGVFPSGGGNPHGLSVDFQGFVWSVNDTNATMAKLRADGTLVGTYSLAGPGSYDWTPYIYSDFTGVQVNRQSPYARAGSWTAIFDGGVSGVPWAQLTWNSEAAGAVPSTTTLVMKVRAADDPGSLAGASYVTATSGAPLVGVLGRFVQVEADLGGPGGLTPVLSDVTVMGPCASGRGPTCCFGSADCFDTDACTADVCPSIGASCEHVAIAGCCNADGECVDADPCTVDRCSGAGGSCVFERIAGCCDRDGDCAGGSCVGHKCLAGPDLGVADDLAGTPSDAADDSAAMQDLSFAPVPAGCGCEVGSRGIPARGASCGLLLALFAGRARRRRAKLV